MVYDMTANEKYLIAYSFVDTGRQVGGACAPLLTWMALVHFSWNVVSCPCPPILRSVFSSCWRL